MRSRAVRLNLSRTVNGNSRSPRAATTHAVRPRRPTRAVRPAPFPPHGTNERESVPRRSEAGSRLRHLEESARSCEGSPSVRGSARRTRPPHENRAMQAAIQDHDQRFPCGVGHREPEPAEDPSAGASPLRFRPPGARASGGTAVRPTVRSPGARTARLEVGQPRAASHRQTGTPASKIVAIVAGRLADWASSSDRRRPNTTSFSLSVSASG